MNKELKQTLLAICQKYDINSRYDNKRGHHIDMWVDGNNAKIELSATESSQWNGALQDLAIELDVRLGGDKGYAYRDTGIIRTADMLGRAAGVTMPGMSAAKQDLLDIYNAMRKKVDEQERAACALPISFPRIQQAFNIQLNEKNEKGR